MHGVYPKSFDGLSIEIEKTSDENLIKFFRDEIKRIDEGEKVTDLLSLRVTRRFLELGILKRTWRNTLILGEKGRYIMGVQRRV